MAILKGGSDTKIEKISNRTVRRCSVAVRIYKPTAVTLQQPNLKAVIIKLYLRRNNQTYTIFHDNLAVLARESMFMSGYQFLSSTTYLSMESDGTGTYYVIPIMLDLGLPINVMGMDELVFEATCTNAWAPNEHDASKGSIDFQWRDEIGKEHVIPQIKTLSVQAASSNVRESLGDNVTSIAFINANDSSSTYIAANNIQYTSVQITSDKYQINDNTDHMIARRGSQFERATDANERGRSFLYVPGPGDVELDNVQITATCNAANIAASECFIVYRSFILDGNTANRAQMLEGKHARRDSEKARKHTASAQATSN